jgi:hypothetical protein
MLRIALQILWPAFMLAGVLEVLVFAMVDPGDMRWFGGAPIDASRQAIYSLAFFAFWAVIAIAAAITALLLTRADGADTPP